MTHIKVTFPFATCLEDYHEGPSVANLLQELTKKTIFYVEDTDAYSKRGYRFIFDVKPLNLDDDGDNFSRDKEAYIAP